MGRGCEQISGNLEINFNEDIPHIMDELRDFFGDVESIHGYLQIHRCTKQPVSLTAP